MAETLTHRTVKNSVYSFVGFVWPLLLSFVAIPVIIRGLGSARYGFFSLLNSVTTLFALLDFGISYTLTQRLSASRNQPEGEELSGLFSATFTLYAIIGLIAMSSLLLLPGLFQHLFKIPTGFISSFTGAFFIVGLVFFLSMVTIPFAQIPLLMQRSDIGVKISLASNAILEIGSIAAIMTGHGILSLLIIQLISSAFVFLSSIFVWRHLAPKLKLRLELPRRALAPIGRNGFWLFISNNMGNILAQLDKFVLGAIWGPAAVGYYSTAQMIPQKISATSFSLSQIFFPVFSEASAQSVDGQNRIKAIFRRSLSIISIIAAGLSLVVLLYGYQLIRFWVSKDFADHTALAVPLLAATYFLLSYGNFFHAFLSGIKALRFLAISTMVVAMTDVVFLFIFIPKHSLNGASLAYLLSSLPMLGILYYVERHYFYSLRREIFGFYGKLAIKIFLVATLTFCMAWFAARPLVTNLTLTMAFGGVTLGVYLSLFWLFRFYQTEDLDLLKVYWGHFLGYFKKA